MTSITIGGKLLDTGSGPEILNFLLSRTQQIIDLKLTIHPNL